MLEISWPGLFGLPSLSLLMTLVMSCYLWAQCIFNSTQRRRSDNETGKASLHQVWHDARGKQRPGSGYEYGHGAEVFGRSHRAVVPAALGREGASFDLMRLYPIFSAIPILSRESKQKMGNNNHKRSARPRAWRWLCGRAGKRSTALAGRWLVWVPTRARSSARKSGLRLAAVVVVDVSTSRARDAWWPLGDPSWISDPIPHPPLLDLRPFGGLDGAPGVHTWLQVYRWRLSRSHLGRELAAVAKEASDIAAPGSTSGSLHPCLDAAWLVAYRVQVHDIPGRIPHRDRDGGKALKATGCTGDAEMRRQACREVSHKRVRQRTLASTEDRSSTLAPDMDGLPLQSQRRFSDVSEEHRKGPSASRRRGVRCCSTVARPPLGLVWITNSGPELTSRARQLEFKESSSRLTKRLTLLEAPGGHADLIDIAPLWSRSGRKSPEIGNRRENASSLSRRHSHRWHSRLTVPVRAPAQKLVGTYSWDYVSAPSQLFRWGLHERLLQ